MQVGPSAVRIPADIIVSGFDLPGGRSPANTGNRPLVDKGDILYMISNDLTIAQVMVLVDQRVVEWFEVCGSDRFEINGSQIAYFIL